MGEGLTAAKLLGDHRIARLAIQAPPVWLWRADMSGLIWANATGAACLGVPSLPALGAHCFSPPDSRAAQIARLAGTLYPGGAPRFERLRGFTPVIGQAIVCACSRIVLADTAAILVAAQEPVGPDLPLADRIVFLLAGADAAMAAFNPEGALIAATPSARAMIGTAKTANAVSALGADALAVAALAEGTATGGTRLGPASVIRVGHDASTTLIAVFAGAPGIAAPTAANGENPAVWLQGAAAAEGLAAEPGPLRIEPPPPDRRVPLRFVWQMDQNGRFTLGSDEFVEAIGSRTAVVLGRPWSEIAAELGLDPENAVVRAIQTRDTWSGIVVSFPIDGSDDRVRVELSGLPVYDRDRTFLGYRGFGVCREVERLTELGWIRRAPVRLDADLVEPLVQQAEGGEAVAPELEERKAVGETRVAGPARPENVLLFPAVVAEAKSRAAEPVPAVAATLSIGEHDAFQEIARRLQSRLASGPVSADQGGGEAPGASGPPVHGSVATGGDAPAMPPPVPAALPAPAGGSAPGVVAVLNELPVGLMIYRYDQPLYANRAFLAATGFSGLEDLIQAGGLDSLSVRTDAGAAFNQSGQALSIVGRDSDKAPIAARLFPVPWGDESAMALMLLQAAASERNRSSELTLRRAEAHIRELRSILDTSFDGLIVLSRDGVILSANRSAEVLFGYEPADFAGRPFGELFMPDSRGAALDQVHRARQGDFVVDGREVTGQTRQGQAIPLSLILGTMPDGADRLYAVFRDLTPWKKSEAELAALRQNAGGAGLANADLLETFSNGVRDALNAITGFADLMLEERFGPLDNERYRGCLHDVRAASRHIGALVEDINNLSRTETGPLDLRLVPVDLNLLVQGCVKTLQADANRERIIVRSSLLPRLRPVLADAPSLQQVIGNLLTNATRRAGAGGQVIVSTGETEHGHVLLRVRDKAAGRKGPDPAGRAAGEGQAPPDAAAGPGADIVRTRTLAEANRGTLNISSKADEGTLFEVSFPGARIPAE